MTPADFAKLAAHLGFDSEAHGRREPVVPMRHGKRRFLASLSGRIGDGSLYSIVVLEAALTSPGALDDASVERINDTLRFARVSRVGEQALVLSMPLRLDGGVTVGWMANAFQHWLAAWRRVGAAPERAANGQGSAGETVSGGWPHGPLRAQGRSRWWSSRW